MDLFTRRRTVVLLVAAALAGTIGLYAYTLTLQPRDLAIAQVGPRDEGTAIRVRGLIANPSVNSRGGLRFNLTEPSSGARIAVYIPGEIFGPMANRGLLVLGAHVQVEGVVQEFRGQLEVLVNAALGVHVLEAAGEARLSLGFFASHPDAFEGMTIVLRGQFSSPRVADGGRHNLTTFTLYGRDDNTTYRIHCVLFDWDWRTDSPRVLAGEQVSFRGKVAYYRPEALWQVTSSDPRDIRA